MTLDKIQLYLKAFNIDLYVKPDFAAKQNQYRLAIRSEISKLTGEDVTNLNIRPQLKQHFVSISHSQHLGGFVLSKKPVGLDIEDKDRLNLKLIERISTEEERSIAPNPLFLWVAKESIFKRFSIDYKVISAVRVVEWKYNDYYWLATSDQGYSAVVFELDISFLSVSF